MAIKSQQRNKQLQGWNSPKAIHPGAILRDMLEEYNITQKELGDRTGISYKIINEIINEKNPISHETASKLSKVFDEDLKFWIDLQKFYELNKTQKEQSKELAAETDKYINEIVHETYRQLVDYKLVKNYRWSKSNYEKIILELQEYFGTASLDYTKKTTLEAAFRKYEQEKVNQYTLAAWLRLGERKASQTKTEPLNESKLEKSLEDIRSLSVKNPDDYLKELEEKLASCGVVLTYAPYFKNTYAQGATQWVNPEKASIILKAENQSEDKLWFNLFHELGHLLLHSKKELFVDFKKEGQKTKIEKEADEFAEKHLIPNFEDLIEKYEGSSQIIEKIANQLNIAESIVAGRISHRHKENKSAWQMTSKYKPKINYTNVS